MCERNRERGREGSEKGLRELVVESEKKKKNSSKRLKAIRG